MRPRFPAAFLTAILFFMAGGSGLLANSRKALTVQSTEGRLDGQTVAEIPAGTEVELLGEKAESGEALIRFRADQEREVLGLVPAASLVEVSPAPSAPAAGHRNRRRTPARRSV